jgi:predicted P-loop ATPase
MQYGFDPGDVNLHRAILQVATEHAYDPVLDYLDECERNYDGVKRLGRAAVDYYQAEDTPFNCEAIKATLVGAVRRARQPGCKFDTIMVLESDVEGRNKSGSISLMHGAAYFSDQTILGKSDKEAQELLAGVWGFECADLSGIGKSDVEAVKSFASRVEDRARPAYGRNTEWRKRRSIMWGTTNDDEYLASQTGNRRFWMLRVLRAIDLEKLAQVRDQLWGEACAIERATKGDINIPEYMWTDGLPRHKSDAAYPTLGRTSSRTCPTS